MGRSEQPPPSRGARVKEEVDVEVAADSSDEQWLSELLTSNSDAGTARKMLRTTSLGVDMGATIGRLREHITEEIRRAAAETEREEDVVKEVEREQERWRRAGSEELLDCLDQDALAEVDVLADVCASLRLTVNEAGHADKRTMWLLEEFDQFAKASAQVAEMETEVAAAADDLRAAARELGQARDVANRLENDLRDREQRAQVDGQRRDMMAVKCGQYEEAVDQVLQQLAASGLSERTRHESIVEKDKEVAQLQEEVDSVERELKRFHGLPPNLAQCQEIASELESAIERADQEVQQALASMM